MLVRRDPLAVLRFAIEQRDWYLAELISERLARETTPQERLAQRATEALVEALDLADPADCRCR